MTPKYRAIFAVSIFFIAFVLSLVFHKQNIASLPISIFYLTLLFNTYFSIKFFSKIIPNNLAQKIIDSILVIFYILLAINTANPIFFLILLALFFILATLKYVALIGILKEPKLLRRKITADFLGIILAIIILALAIYGYILISLWCLVVIFSFANIYTLFISPLYKLDNKIV